MAYVETDSGLKLRGDIKFFYSQSGDYAPADIDIDKDTNDAVTDAGLETTILILLFSDRRAGEEDIIPDGSDERRGWWGDELIGQSIGSKLWLLQREKTLSTLASRLEEYTVDGLQALVTLGIADKVDATATRVSANAYSTAVTIKRSAKQDITFTYYYNWLAQTIGGKDAI